jgi:hypothetical protein
MSERKYNANEWDLQKKQFAPYDGQKLRDKQKETVFSFFGSINLRMGKMIIS